MRRASLCIYHNRLPKTVFQGLLHLPTPFTKDDGRRSIDSHPPVPFVIHRTLSNSNNDTETNKDKAALSSSISNLSKEAATMPIDYPTSRRMWALPPAIAIHLSIGSVYVYSMWTPGMAKALGMLFDHLSLSFFAIGVSILLRCIGLRLC
jgi:hypothetical protein